MSLHGSVRVVGFFGSPLTQTVLSDALNAAFEGMRLDLASVPFDVAPAALSEALEAMRSLSFVGASIGMPHKEAVLALLDEVGPTAQMVGSVDHIGLQGGKLVGHNADLASGQSVLTDDAGLALKGKKALLFGAGGTARSFAVGLLEDGAEVRIANRTPARAEALVSRLKRLFPDGKVAALPFEARELGVALKDSDILINATPANLDGPKGPLVYERDLHSALTVVDATIARATPLALSAKRAGAKAFTGTRLMFWHAYHSFRLWTGRAPDREGLEKAFGGVLAVAG